MKRIRTKMLLSFIVLLGFMSCRKNSLDEDLSGSASLKNAKLASSVGITNPSFEDATGDDFSGWTFNGNATFSATTTSGEVHDGSHALKVVNPTANGTSGFSRVGATTDSIATQIGKAYRVRIWARSGSTSIARIGFTAFGTTTQFVPHQTISNSWQYYDWVFTANSNFTRIKLDLGADANTFFIDNVSIVQIPDAPPSLIKNGSFEEGAGNSFTNWSTAGTGTFSVATASGEVYKGSRALKVVNPTANGTSGFSKVGVTTDSVATEIGKTYKVRIWARSANSGTARIGFTVFGNPTQYVKDQTISTSYKPYEWMFPANSNFTRIKFDLGADANTYLIDSVSMVKVDTVYSRIWGRDGELWNTARIPDFTNAGYMNGTQPIPDFPVQINLTDVGGVGNGVTDNTAALRAAIKQCPANGTIYIPAGKYLIKDTIMVKRSNINIKGAGASTILYFDKGLEELYPKYNTSTPNQTPWSYSGGMISFAGNISNSGIQSLKILFPDKAWAGHNFRERGYNALTFLSGANNCWVKNVVLTGCDSGISIVAACSNITVDQCLLDAGPVRAANSAGIGHHGVGAAGPKNLFQNFEIKGKFSHDISLGGTACTYNVIRNGKATDLNIDLHSHEPRKNLFTNLDAGRGKRIYESGGTNQPAGVNIELVYWNIDAVNQMPYNHIGGSKSRNNVAVGIKTGEASTLPDAYGNWYETISPTLLYPQDLYVSQMKKIKNITVN